MAKICTVTNEVINKIVNEISEKRLSGILNGASNATILNETTAYLASLNSQYRMTAKAIKLLKTKLDTVGITADESTFPTRNMESIISDGGKVEIPTVNNDNSTTKLEESERNVLIKDVKSDFLVKAYGTATEVRQAAEHSAAVALFNKVVIDRENGRKVETEHDINDNLRHYQQQLLWTIKEYITERNKKIGVDNSIWDDITMYKEDNGVLTYTKKVHDLESEILKALSHDNFPDELLNFYFESPEGSYERKALDAYNAWQILSHFDTFVQLRYGKSLEISNFGDMFFTGQDKYKKADKGANNKTTWRTTEEIILSDEIDKIVQEMVTSTPLYSYGSPIPMTNAYLSFNAFCQVIGKLKDIGWKSGDLVFDFNSANQVIREKSQLSSRSMRVLQGESIQSVINRIRENPSKYLSAILEAMSNTYWYNQLAQKGFLTDFNDDEKDVIYTIHKGLTGDYNENSIASIDYSLYGQIAQSVDSIFTVKFLQYYTGLDDVTKVRSMSDDRLDGIIRNIKQSIITQNSKLNPNHCIIHEDGTATIRGNIKIIPNLANKKLQSITIKIPNTEIEATIQKNGDVTYKRSGKIFKSFSKSPTQNFSQLCDFVTEITGQNINQNIIELVCKRTTSGTIDANNFGESEKKLVDLACRSVFLSYISNTEFGGIKSKSNLSKKIKGFFGNTSVKINTNMREIDLVHNKDISTIERLANAIAIQRGLYASSVIKSGDGSSYSVQSLSRLIGSLRQQWELQNKKDDSASKGLLILDPDAFKGIYTAREYYDLTRSTDHTDFSVKEFGSAMFVQDFIGGLCDNSDDFNPLLGNGKIAILPSVNSDKNTIGRIIIDTTKTVNINGEDIQIRNLTIDQLETFICKELGQLYSNILYRTDADFDKLFTWINQTKGLNIKSKKARLTLDNTSGLSKYNNEAFFAEFNEAFKLRETYIDLDGTDINLSWDEIVANNPDAESYEFLGVTYKKGQKPKKLYESAKILNSFIKEYNLAHRNNPISFTDQVHFIENKDGSIGVNSVLQGYQSRFKNPTELNEFFYRKSTDVLGTLLRNNFRVDLANDSKQATYIKHYFKDNPEWINKDNGEMVLGKLRIQNDTETEVEVEVDIIGQNHLNNFYYQLSHDEVETKGEVITRLSPLSKIKQAEAELEETINKHKDKEGFEYTLAREKRRLDELKRLREGIIKKEILYNPQLIADLHEFGVEFELNPLLNQYNHLDYLFSQEFMISTVGSLIAHPAKGALNNSLEAQEAARFNAQHKRNVSYTAAMQEFTLGLMDGIPSDYNIAVVKDVFDLVGNVTGNEDSVKPYDGATFVNPFIVYLENASLGAAKAGITKKQFVHFYDEHTATGGIIKTCGFGITNDWMRNSPRLQKLMRKMTNGTWIDSKNQPVDLDITHAYDDSEIGYDDIYFRKNGQYYHITSIKKVGINAYDIKGTVVDVTNKSGQLQAKYKEESDEVNLNSLFGGDEKTPVIIDNNYKLWEVFGGKNSLILDKTELIPSETSITNVVKTMNSVGITQEDASNVRTQDDIYQPLKHSDIHYVATEGAVKQGAANINTSDLYDGDKPLNFMRIHMYQAGIQLDKEHHADNSELSLMTQVVNACAHLGYSLEESLSMFNALRSITDTDTAVLLDPIKDYLSSDNEISKEINYKKAKEAIVNTVLKAISKQTLQDNDLLRVFADDLITTLKEGGVLKYDDFKDTLPVDNPGIYSKFMSSISVFLTKTGIKMKIPGILSVLTPSYGIMLTYQIPVVKKDKSIEWHTCKWEQVESYAEQAGMSVEEYLNTIQINAPKVKSTKVENNEINLNISNFRLGRSYFMRIGGKDKVIKIDSAKKYKAWKQRILTDATITSVVEDIRKGRELGTYDVEFEGIIDSETSLHSLYDLDSIQNLYDLKDAIDSKDKNVLINFVARLGYSDFIDIEKETVDVKGVEKALRKLVRRDLAVFSKDGGKFFEDLKAKEVFVKINGENVLVNRSTIKKTAYEMVLPKIFIEEFGLETNDQLDEIEHDPMFFSKRLVQKFTKEIDPFHYDIALKNISGKHWYLAEKIAVSTAKIFQKLEIQKFVEDNKLYWIDKNGNQICELYSDKDEVYRDQEGNYIIVPGEDESKGISQDEGFVHYLNHLNYSTVQISGSEHVDDQLFEIYLDLIKQSNNRTARRYVKYITAENVTGNDYTTDGHTDQDLEAQAAADNMRAMRERNNQFSLYKESDLDSSENPITKMLVELGHEIHSSFIKSLEIVASRTPSQSMQSFMPMRIAAFDNPNLNTAYVSTMQIWLQGSDYDVDAVSVAAFAIDKSGKLPLWSPYANISTLFSLNQSMELPFPTGKTMNVIDYKLNQLKDEERNEKEAIIKEIYTKYLRSGLFVFARKNDSFVLKFNNESNNLPAIKTFLEEINANGLPLPFQNFEKEILNQEILEKLFPDVVDFSTLDFTKLNIFDDIQKLVNNHNLYLTKLPKSKVDQISKNKQMYDMYNISNDPINLIQAQAPVDVMTGPLKEQGDKQQANKLLGNRTPGNVFNKAESIEDNQVGKDGIGICAVGLKGFFGATTYANMLAKYGENDELSRLVLGKEGIKIHVPGQIEPKVFKYMANINPQLSMLDGSNTEKILYEALTNNNSDTDAALILSALLSLATDNAKELQLSKLNAGTKTIGMYIYGTAIGMEFQDLVKIMTSDVALMITDLTKGNVFTNEKGLFSLDSVFSYLENGPMSLLTKYANPIIHDGTVYTSILQQVGNFLNKKMENKYGKDSRNLTLNQVLGKIAWIGQTNKQMQEEWNKLNKKGKSEYKNNFYEFRVAKLKAERNEKIKLLNDMKAKSKLKYSTIFGRASTEYASEQDMQKFNQCISRLQDYVRQVYVVKNHMSTYRSIKTLAEGGEEFRVLGQILGLNQGLKTKPEELLQKVYSIQNIIQDRYNVEQKKQKRDYIRNALHDTSLSKKINIHKNTTWKMFDLFKFCTDDEYKAAQTKKYDTIKHSINILDVAATVPHFAGYLQTLALAHEACKTISSKYRTIDKLAGNYEEGKYDGYANRLKVKNSQDLQYLFKGLGNFYSDYIRRAWMIDNGITLDIPEGTKILVNGNLKDSETILQLGTRDGDASFKYLMDSVIIPTIKQGKLSASPNIHTLQSLLKNKFIQNLTTSLITNTPTKNPIVLYTLPINMMPSSDEEYQVFNTYKSEFNKIRDYKWTFNNGVQIPLVDLFYYYGLIAHYGKQGPQSLMPIFENLHSFKNYKINDFHKYEAAFNEDLSNIGEESLLPYILPVKSLYDITTKKGYAKDPDNMLTVLWVKQSKTSEDYGDYDEDLDDEYTSKRKKVINGYVKQVNPLLNSDYVNSYSTIANISSNLIDGPKIFTYTNKENGITYNVKITEFKFGEKEVSVEGLDESTIEFLKKHPELNKAEVTKKVSSVTGRNVTISEEYYNAAIEQALAEETNNCPK